MSRVGINDDKTANMYDSVEHKMSKYLPIIAGLMLLLGKMSAFTMQSNDCHIVTIQGLFSSM